MFKFRIGFFLYQHKLCIRSASVLTQNISCSKAVSTSLVATHPLRLSSPVVIPSRTFWETFPSPKRSFHAKDGLDEDNYELIYRNRLFNYAFYGQLVSELTLLSQVGYSIKQCINYFSGMKVGPSVTQIGPYVVTYDIVAWVVLTLFTAQNVALFIGSQKCLLRVYHKKDTDEYVFISLAINPFKVRKIICKPGELKSLQNLNLWAILLGNYHVKDSRYFLRLEHFKTNYHFNRLVYEQYEDY